jgi:hypothetical protein
MLFDHGSPTGAFLRSLAAASVIARSEEIKNTEKKAHAEKREVFLMRCITCERTFATRFHFERIAHLLLCGRYKRLNRAGKKAYAQKCDAFLNCMTEAERQACEDLSAVRGDPKSASAAAPSFRVARAMARLSVVYCRKLQLFTSGRKMTRLARSGKEIFARTRKQ